MAKNTPASKCSKARDNVMPAVTAYLRSSGWRGVRDDGGVPGIIQTSICENNQRFCASCAQADTTSFLGEPQPHIYAINLAMMAQTQKPVRKEFVDLAECTAGNDNVQRNFRSWLRRQRWMKALPSPTTNPVTLWSVIVGRICNND